MEQQKPKKQKIDFNLQSFEGDERAAMAAMYEETLKNFTEGSIIFGKIIEIRDDGVLVDIGYKSEGLIPTHEFKKDEIAVGDKVEVLLEHLENDEGMVCLSKEQAEQQRNWDRVLSDFTEGATIEGTIRTRVKGGLIVDVGVDAFLPGSQLDVVPVRNVEVQNP